MSAVRVTLVIATLTLLVAHACTGPVPEVDPAVSLHDSNSPGADAAKAADVDIVFHGGTFYTGNPDQPSVAAVAARDGWIVYAGERSGALALAGARTKVIDLKGATGFPGFTDSHVHIGKVGQAAQLLDLRGTTSLGDLLRRLQARVAITAPGEWIVGRGWIETFWEPAHFPSRFDLDAVSPLHPVFLWRVDGHGAIANSAALRLAGIDADTASPPGGEILRKDGQPTGVLLDAAMPLVLKHVPARTIEQQRADLTAGADIYRRRGWTAIQVAGQSREAIAALQRLSETGAVPLRVSTAVYGPGQEANEFMNQGAIGGQRGSMFTARSIKVSYDGALGSTGAALLEPYADRPNTRGLLKHDDTVMLAMLEKSLRRGIQLQVHAIGDRANRRILDLFEATFAAVPTSERALADPRWRVEHAQILHPDDLPRFAQLGVIPSMQPSHAITDLHFAPARLGRGRLRGAYAWRALIDSGCRIAGGTDAPVEEGDPLLEFYAACVRKDPRVDPAGVARAGWHLEQRVTREEALQMFTSWAAYAAFQEEWRGTIEVGKVCDLTVFSRDLMSVPDEQILGTRCLYTVVGGEVIYAAEEAR